MTSFPAFYDLATLHPENAESCLRHRRIESRRKCQRQHPPRFRWRNDAVIPQPCGCVIGIALGLKLVAQRLLKLFFFDFRPFASLGLDILAFDGRQDARRLFATHDRDASVWPSEQKARPVGTPAHAIVSGTV